jgi:hypothetical protein
MTSRSPSLTRQERSALDQLKLNVAIAPIRVLGRAGIDRLKFAEPTIKYCTTGIARAADRSQFYLNWLRTIGRTSV